MNFLIMKKIIKNIINGAKSNPPIGMKILSKYPPLLLIQTGQASIPETKMKKKKNKNDVVFNTFLKNILIR